VNVPGFLVRQFYVPGSLRNTETGFTLQARNPLGDGTLVGVGRLSVDGLPIPVEAVTAIRESDSRVFRASDVSPAAPIEVRQGDRVTLSIAGEPLAPGKHRLEVELTEQNVGPLRLSVTDTVQ
jgi:hydroxymethylglutaryl-CoA reductase (NADPH)